MDFQENPFNGRRYTVERVLCRNVKWPALQTEHDLTYKFCRTWGLSAKVWVTGKSHEWKKSYNWEGTLFLQV